MSTENFDVNDQGENMETNTQPNTLSSIASKREVKTAGTQAIDRKSVV